MPTRHVMGAWLLALCVPVIAHAQERTEKELLDLILREGPQAIAIRAGVEAVRREQAARTVIPNPALSYTREGAGLTEFVQAEQLLPIGGTRAAVARAGVAAVAAAEAERDARLWRLHIEAREAIARIGSEQDRLAAAESTAAAIARLIDLLRVREQEGEGSRFDRLRAEQELADVKQQQLEAGASLVAARSQLVALLPPNVSFSRLTDRFQTLEPAALEPVFAQATGARAELRGLEHSAARFRHEAEAARRARRPIPTVVGGVKRAAQGSSTGFGGVFGVSVNVPVFDTGAREVARWEAERQRVERERASLISAIRAEVQRAIDVLSLHQRALAEFEASRVAADELTQIADTAYREGEVGILELLDAYRTAARARTRTIEVQITTRQAQIALERAVGEPLW